MAKYFGFNTLAGAKRSSTGVVEAATVGRFDAGYVANGISVPAGGEYLEIGAPFLDGSASVATLWTRFDVFLVTTTSANTVLALWLNAGANAYRLIKDGTGNFQMQYWNSGTAAWVNWGGTFALAVNTLYTIVCQIVASTSFQLFVGGALTVSSVVAPTNPAAAITTFRGLSVGNAQPCVFSQVMGADYDIRDAHFLGKLANGEGTYTNGTGVFGDINEVVLDESTAISLPAVGNKHSFTKAAIAVPAGQQIGSMIVNARARVSGGVVVDGKILCRSGSTDSAPSAMALNAGYEPRGHAFDNDPATGTRWTQAGFNAAEFGLQAA